MYLGVRIVQDRHAAVRMLRESLARKTPLPVASTPDRVIDEKDRAIQEAWR